MSSWRAGWRGFGQSLAELLALEGIVWRPAPDVCAGAGGLEPAPLVRPPGDEPVTERDVEQRELELRILMANWM